MIGRQIRCVNHYGGRRLNHGIGVAPAHHGCPRACWPSLGFSDEHVEQFTQRLNWKRNSPCWQSLNQLQRLISHDRSIRALGVGQDIGVQGNFHRTSSYSSSRVQRPTLTARSVRSRAKSAERAPSAARSSSTTGVILATGLPWLVTTTLRPFFTVRSSSENRRLASAAETALS